MQAHMDAMIEPVRRIIARLLEADAQFFRERYYLDPLLARPADQWCVLLNIVINNFVLYYIFGVRFMLLIWCLFGCIRFWAQDAFLCGLPHLCAYWSLCLCRSRTFAAVYIFEIEPSGVSIFKLKVWRNFSFIYALNVKIHWEAQGTQSVACVQGSEGLNPITHGWISLFN
jgi:hypothetical protein